MKALIVDDEIKSRKLLYKAINDYTQGVEIIGQASSVKTALVAIEELSPEVLFLDIQLQDGTGFDIIEKIESSKYKVVFVTAYDSYAIRAIKCGAIDYLVKPIDLEDLGSTIERLKTIPSIANENLEIIKKEMAGVTSKKIMASTSNGYISLNLDDITAFVAYGNYVFIHTDDQKHMATNSIQYYEELLPPNIFYRIHRSHIVNINKVVSVDRRRAGKVTMTNKMQLDLAARRKTAFLDELKKSFIK